MDFNKKFKDKVVLVTGSSKGIGRDMILSFAGLGAKVAINHYDEDNSKADETLDLVRKITKDVIIFKKDITNAKELDSMFVKIQKDLGNRSILVNNAGIAIFSSF